MLIASLIESIDHYQYSVLLFVSEVLSWAFSAPACFFSLSLSFSSVVDLLRKWLLFLWFGFGILRACTNNNGRYLPLLCFNSLLNSGVSFDALRSIDKWMTTMEAHINTFRIDNDVRKNLYEYFQHFYAFSSILAAAAAATTVVVVHCMAIIKLGLIMNTRDDTESYIQEMKQKEKK